MATEDPYIAPATPVGDWKFEVPDGIQKKIKRAWVTALISATVTLGATLLAMSGTEILGFSAWELFDVALILGLAFGIYKKSRTCAVIMLIYFIVSKILLISETGRPTGVIMALAFVYFFWQGVSGTFAYHRLKRQPLEYIVSGG